MDTLSTKPIDDSLLIGVGEGTRLAHSPTVGGPNQESAGMPLLVRDDSLIVPKGLGNINLGKGLSSYTHRDKVKAAAANKIKLLSLSDGDTTELGDDGPPSDSGASPAAKQQHQPCQHIAAGVRCTCLTETHLTINHEYFDNIQQRVFSGANITDYPVTEVFGVQIDREQLYRTFWGYKQKDSQ